MIFNWTLSLELNFEFGIYIEKRYNLPNVYVTL